MKQSIACALMMVALLAGCTMQPKKVAIQSEFVERDHDVYVKDGPNLVTGQAFLRQQGGGTVTCAGARVVLLPATAFFREAATIMMRGEVPENNGNKPSKAYAASLTRNTRCDAQGNFDFSKVPAGRYLLMSEVTWTVGNSRQGGLLSREVDVTDGTQNRFLLSDTDRISRR